ALRERRGSSGDCEFAASCAARSRDSASPAEAGAAPPVYGQGRAASLLAPGESNPLTQARPHRDQVAGEPLLVVTPSSNGSRGVQQAIALDLPHDLATAHLKQLEVLELSAIREPLPPLLIDERAIHIGAHERDSQPPYDAPDRR